MTDLPSGVPIWIFLVSTLLSGGMGAAILQYLTERSKARTGSVTAVAEGRLKDVTALGAALTSLQGENERLSKRLASAEEKNEELEQRVDDLEAELGMAEARIRELQTGNPQA